MSCILKPTMPTSCSSDLYVACPTMINVYDWLMKHHTTVTSGECCGKTYHIFAVTDFPVFGSKCEYISTNVGIPLGPLSLELATEIDVRSDCVPHRDQVTINVKYPLLPSVKAGTFKGDLRSGITMSIGVPEIYGSIRIWIEFDFYGSRTASLWVEFDLCVFGVEYKGKFAVLPIPIWFLMSSDKLIQAAGLTKASLSGHHEHEHEAPSITLHNETNNITNIVVAATVADTTAPASSVQAVAAQ